MMKLRPTILACLAIILSGAVLVYEINYKWFPPESVLAQGSAGQGSRLTPDCQFGFNYSVVNNIITAQPIIGGTRTPAAPTGGPGQTLAGWDNRATGCITWTITYNTQGVTASSFELDQAPDNNGVPGSWSTWTSPAIGTAFPIVTSAAGAVGQGTAFNYQPWVSINLNSATGTGIVYGLVVGWRGQAGQDASAPGNAFTVSGYNRTAITTAVNTQIKATTGVVHTITITQPGATANSITVVDTNVAACTGGTTILTIPTADLPASMVPVTLTLDMAFSAGICVTTAGTTSPQLAVSWR